MEVHREEQALTRDNSTRNSQVTSARHRLEVDTELAAPGQVLNFKKRDLVTAAQSLHYLIKGFKLTQCSPTSVARGQL